MIFLWAIFGAAIAFLIAGFAAGSLVDSTQSGFTSAATVVGIAAIAGIAVFFGLLFFL